MHKKEKKKIIIFAAFWFLRRDPSMLCFIMHEVLSGRHTYIWEVLSIIFLRISKFNSSETEVLKWERPYMTNFWEKRTEQKRKKWA